MLSLQLKELYRAPANCRFYMHGQHFEEFLLRTLIFWVLERVFRHKYGIRVARTRFPWVLNGEPRLQFLFKCLLVMEKNSETRKALNTIALKVVVNNTSPLRKKKEKSPTSKKQPDQPNDPETPLPLFYQHVIYPKKYDFF